MRPDLPAIADAVGTPFYAYEADVFRARVRAFLTELDDAPHLVCFAVKANDALAILRIAAGEGLGADVVSGGELQKALRAGVPPGRIVFSGVAKQRDEIRAALDAGVRSLNIESLGELDTVAAVARELGRPAPVSVRLNPDVTAETHAYLTTGSATSKFGLLPEEALAAYERVAADDALEAVGLSFHVGSQLLDPAPVLTAAEQAAELWNELARRGFRLRDLDVGGGLGVPYDGGDDPDVRSYVSRLRELAGRLGATLVLEPGRYLVAPAGTFVTRVLYVKERPGATIAVCDGGTNDLVRPALYLAEHPVSILGDTSGRETALVDVAGPLCESSDYLARGREVPAPQPGDLLAIGVAGAYGRVMSSTYNGRPLCAEVLIEGDSWRVTRQAGAFADLVRGEEP